MCEGPCLGFAVGVTVGLRSLPLPGSGTPLSWKLLATCGPFLEKHLFIGCLCFFLFKIWLCGVPKGKYIFLPLCLPYEAAPCHQKTQESHPAGPCPSEHTGRSSLSCSCFILEVNGKPCGPALAPSGHPRLGAGFSSEVSRFVHKGGCKDVTTFFHSSLACTWMQPSCDPSEFEAQCAAVYLTCPLNPSISTLSVL